MPPTPPEVVIEPRGRLQLVPWAELREYRDLLWQLVWRDLTARYRQTILGPLWFLLQPALTTAVFVLLSRVARIGTGGVPATLFYLCGLLPWSYFASSFNSTAATLANNASLFGKVYFPRLLLPLSGVLSNLAALGIQGALFAVVYAVFKQTASGASFGATGSALLLPLVIAQVAALSLGVGLWLAALTARYRDFGLLAGFALQIWMYATPVLYPLAALNPMALPEEWTRRMLLGTGVGDVRLGAISVGMSALALVGGLAAFSRAERTFVDIA